MPSVSSSSTYITPSYRRSQHCPTVLFLGNLMPSHSFILHPNIFQKYLCLYPLSHLKPNYLLSLPSSQHYSHNFLQCILEYWCTEPRHKCFLNFLFLIFHVFPSSQKASTPHFHSWIFHRSISLLILLKCHHPGETLVLFQDFLL